MVDLSWLKQRLTRFQRRPADTVVVPLVASVAAPTEATGALALPYRLPLLAALLGALGLAVLGHYMTARGAAFQRAGLAVVVVGLALLIVAQSLFRQRAVPHWLETASTRLRLAADQPILLALAFVCAYAAKVIATDVPRPLNPVLPYLVWGGAIALAILASYRPGLDAAGAAAEASLGQPWQRWERVGVCLLFVVALAVRGLLNGQVPAALSGDEGSAGLMAVEWAEGRFVNPFVVGWFSFPALFFALPATAISMLGRTYAALRAPSALAGALTVAGLYWMARPFFGRPTALLSAIVLVSLNLHVHFSRIGLNNIWDGLFAVLTVGFFWRGWQSGRRGYFVAAGLVMGLSQYFYASALLLPLILGSWFGLQLVFNRSVARQRLPDLLSMALVALVVYLPLGLFYLSHPTEFLAPLNRVSLLRAGWFEGMQRTTGLPIWRIVLDNFRDAALGFTMVPLRAWYGAGKPLLLPLPAGLFVLGVALLLSDLRAPRSWLPLLWIAGVTAIGALTESTPAGQRYVIAAPVAALLVGWAVATLASWLSEAWPRGRRLVGVLALGLVLFGAAQDLNFYFTQYTPTIGRGDLNTQVASTLGLYLKGYPEGSRAYFFGAPRMGYLGFSTLRFLAPNVQAEDIVNVLTAPPDWPPAEARTAFIVLPERHAEAALVVERYPGGEARWFYDQKGEALFWLYELPPD